jgi:hypothetical protein
MTDNERAVIEAAVEWLNSRSVFGGRSTSAGLAARHLEGALNELHNEHDGRWEPSDD